MSPEADLRVGSPDAEVDRIDRAGDLTQARDRSDQVAEALFCVARGGRVKQTQSTWLKEVQAVLFPRVD